MSRERLPTSVRLPRELSEFLRKRAKQESRSISWLIESIIRQWMETLQRKGVEQ